MSMTIDVETRGAVRVLRWRDGENRCNAASMNRWHEVLAGLETIDGPLALVIVGEGKYFSNGLDLDRFTAHPEEAGPTVEGLHRLFGRLLLFPAYTVAAINGHAFAGGAMLTCACDLRVMRADRGYWCLPEVDLGLPLTDGMKAVVTARLPRTAAADAMMTGRRYGAAEALARGIVEHTAPEAEVLDRAVALAAEIAPKNRTVIAAHKRLLFGDAARVCGWPS
jgi:enoyl-CoA hydratase/carnithine racemase